MTVKTVQIDLLKKIYLTLTSKRCHSWLDLAA